MYKPNLLRHPTVGIHHTVSTHEFFPTPPTYFSVEQAGKEEEKGESDSLSSLIDINELTPVYPYGASEHQDKLDSQSASSQPSC
jgi:hypothetical protein